MIGGSKSSTENKEFHYYVTSVVSALTAFTTWQTLKNQFFIYQRRSKINQIEKSDIKEVHELTGSGAKINDVVLVKVTSFLLREKLELRMEKRFKYDKVCLKIKSLLFICPILKECTQMTLLTKKITFLI